MNDAPTWKLAEPEQDAGLVEVRFFAVRASGLLDIAFPRSAGADLQPPVLRLVVIDAVGRDVVARGAVDVGRHAEMRADAIAVPFLVARWNVRQRELEAGEDRREIEQLLQIADIVDAEADRVGGEGVGAPLVGRIGGEVGGAAGREHAHGAERVVDRADAQLAEAAGEIDPGLVDLVAVAFGRDVVLAFELDARADLEPVVEHGRTGEVDFRVGEHAVGVASRCRARLRCRRRS